MYCLDAVVSRAQVGGRGNEWYETVLRLGYC